MDIVTAVPRYGHPPRFCRMLELAMAADGSYQIPAIRFQQFEQVTYFHLSNQFGPQSRASCFKRSYHGGAMLANHFVNVTIGGH